MALLNVVRQYGAMERTTKGYTCFMDSRARERARIALGDEAYRRIADRLNFYLVLSPEQDCVLTVAHRTQRRKRP